MDQESSLECHASQPSIHVYNFKREAEEKTYHFHVLKLEESLFFWVGTSAKMDNLCVAMNTKYDVSPAVSILLGSQTDSSCNPLAQRLAKKTQKQCFVSLNHTLDDKCLGFVEQALMEEMKENPSRF